MRKNCGERQGDGQDMALDLHDSMATNGIIRDIYFCGENAKGEGVG